MSLCIVPDTNPLYGDPFFKGVTLQSILLSAKRLDIKLVIADLIRDELRNIVSERAKDVADKMRRLSNEAKSLNLGVKTEPPDDWRLNLEVSKVAENFDAHIIQHQASHGSLPYPEVTTGELASRAIQRKRPFQDNDRGLRDSLLWLAIIESAKATDDDYVLVSADKVFWDDQGDGLHPQLLQELKDNNLQGRVQIRKSLASVLGDYVKPKLEPADVVRVAVEVGEIPDFREESDAVLLAIYDFVSSIEIPDEWLMTGGYYGVELDVVEDANLDEVVSAHEIQDEEAVLVTSEWEASINVLLPTFGYGEETQTPVVTFTIESLINPNTLEVQGHEVTDHRLKGWWDADTETWVTY